MKFFIATALAALVAAPTLAGPTLNPDLGITELAAAGHVRMPNTPPIDPEYITPYHQHHAPDQAPEDAPDTDTEDKNYNTYWSIIKHWNVIAPYGAGAVTIPTVDKHTCDVVMKSLDAADLARSLRKPFCINTLTGEIYKGK